MDVAVVPGLPRRPIFIYWSIAVAIEFVLAAVFLLTGADQAIQTGLDRSGLEFSSDFITAARVGAMYPAALIGIGLSLLQVAAPDLAVIGVSCVGGGRYLLRQVHSRLRFWSKEVGPRRGLTVWAAMLATFIVCNLASGWLHARTLPQVLDWNLGVRTVLLLPVAMFLDAGAVLEESGWRGYCMPVALRKRGPVAASLVVGLAWASWHYPVKFNLFVDYGLGGALAVLGAFTVKLLALSIVMTFFWAHAGQATMIAIAMHGLSNDVARVGGLTSPETWQGEALTEVNLAVPYVIAAMVVILVARRRGWGDLRAIDREQRPRDRPSPDGLRGARTP